MCVGKKCSDELHYLIKLVSKVQEDQVELTRHDRTILPTYFGLSTGPGAFSAGLGGRHRTRVYRPL